MAERLLFGKLKISEKVTDCPGKNPECDQKGNGKNDLFNHVVLVLRFGLQG